MHVVIPAGPGGGLDGTAREAGRALVELGLLEQVSFENVSGGGGGRAMAHFLENADRFDLPVLVNSTPLVLRSLQGLFPFGFRDLTPVAALIGDHGVFVVRADSDIVRWNAVVEALKQAPGKMIIGGGSVRGSLDHVVLALALEAAELPVRAARYVPYDGGGKAMLALLGGEVELLSSGLGESMPFLTAGEARALAVTSATRIPALPDVPDAQGTWLPGGVRELARLLRVADDARGGPAEPGRPASRDARLPALAGRTRQARLDLLADRCRRVHCLS